MSLPRVSWGLVSYSLQPSVPQVIEEALYEIIAVRHHLLISCILDFKMYFECYTYFDMPQSCLKSVFSARVCILFVRHND